MDPGLCDKHHREGCLNAECVAIAAQRGLLLKLPMPQTPTPG